MTTASSGLDSVDMDPSTIENLKAFARAASLNETLERHGVLSKITFDIESNTYTHEHSDGTVETELVYEEALSQALKDVLESVLDEIDKDPEPIPEVPDF